MSIAPTSEIPPLAPSMPPAHDDTVATWDCAEASHHSSCTGKLLVRRVACECWCHHRPVSKEPKTALWETKPDGKIGPTEAGLAVWGEHDWLETVNRVLYRYDNEFGVTVRMVAEDLAADLRKALVDQREAIASAVEVVEDSGYPWPRRMIADAIRSGGKS